MHRSDHYTVTGPIITRKSFYFKTQKSRYIAATAFSKELSGTIFHILRMARRELYKDV